MSCNFSYKHYMYMMKLMKESNYRFIYFSEAGKYDKEIILRHDVDLCTSKALKMAEIEKKLDIKSTYCIWLTSPFYNLFDPSNKRNILEIFNMGHEIGLHFNENIYLCNSEKEIKYKILKEIDIIKNYLNIDIKTISFHIPNKNILDNTFQWDGMINTYNHTFFSKYKYLSDSEMRWREGCLCNNYIKYEKLQVLIHPIWWNDEDKNKIDIVNNYFDYKIKEIKSEWNYNIRV